LITDQSRFPGRQLGELMNSLGLAPSLALKIRRRIFKVDSESAQVPLDRSLLQETRDRFWDQAFWKRVSGLYPPEKVITERLQEMTAAGFGAVNGVEKIEAPSSSDDFVDILLPGPNEILGIGDIVFIANAQDTVGKLMKSIAGESRGLELIGTNALDLPGYGTELLEAVVSDRFPFLGQTVSEMSLQFGSRFGAAIITARGKQWGEDANEGGAKEQSEKEGDKTESELNYQS